eukprot:2167458-Ditylum_brightwellii.AAC.1
MLGTSVPPTPPCYVKKHHYNTNMVPSNQSSVPDVMKNTCIGIRKANTSSFPVNTNQGFSIELRP